MGLESAVITLSTVEIEVVGRDGELAAVRGFLESVDRLPAALLIAGEAGIGKTTLWRSAITSAAQNGYRVLSTRPAQTESQLSYAGLADLLEPVLEDALPELPTPQRRALEVALLLRDAGDDKPDQTAIAFALLGVLRAAARERPTLVAVDDFQWLDASSSFALLFAARRLREDQVGFIFAVRAEVAAGSETSLGLGRLLSEEQTSRIDVVPLSLGGVQRLIQSRLGLVLTRPTLRRLYDTSGGNPFFALELARALRDRGDELEPGDPLPVSGELRQLLRARLDALPAASAEALLFAAALRQPTVGFVGEAMGEDARGSLRRAAGAGLIELDGDTIHFTHPLFAAAVYAEATADRMREIHRRLAEIVGNVEERARHLALGAEGMDVRAASALDEAARIARARGAPQAAAELSELALRLTPEPETEAAHRRRLDAGAASFEAGDTVRARTLFADAAELARASPLRAEALGRLAWVHHYAGDQRVAIGLFRECLADEHAETRVRADAAEGLATSLFFLREELADALRHARLARSMAEKEGSRAALAVTLGTQGMIEAVLGRREAIRTLRSAIALEEHARDLPLQKRPSFQRAVTLVWRDDLESARASLRALRERAAERGDASSLPFVLGYLGLADFLSGRWEEAMDAADEGNEVALAAGQETGRAFPLSVRALVAGCLGREERARSDAEEALVLAKRGAMFGTSTSLWGLGLLELSLSRPREAHEHLRALVDQGRVAGIAEPGAIRFVTDDIEALIALGELETAATELERFERLARRLRRYSALAASSRCRGLLALAEGVPDNAVTELTRSLDELERLTLPLERARTLLGLGIAQRHARQRRAARETLGRAIRGFEELGASLWAERARTELGRIGGRAPSRGELTASEHRVATLVAEGRTNREVARVLFVTPRTVEGTLSRVYAKLGLRSRAELARYWAARES